MSRSAIMQTKLVFFVLFYFVFVKDAYAYLDPGTGSYILQMIIAGFLGVLYAIKLFWNNIVMFFRNLFSMRRRHEKIKS